MKNKHLGFIAYAILMLSLSLVGCSTKKIVTEKVKINDQSTVETNDKSKITTTREIDTTITTQEKTITGKLSVNDSSAVDSAFFENDDLTLKLVYNKERKTIDGSAKKKPKQIPVKAQETVVEEKNIQQKTKSDIKTSTNTRLKAKEPAPTVSKAIETIVCTSLFFVGLCGFSYAVYLVAKQLSKHASNQNRNS